MYISVHTSVHVATQAQIGQIKKVSEMAVIVAQLVEQSLPTLEIRGSNTVIGKLLYRTFICLLSTELKRQNKEKEGGNGPFKKRKSQR